MTKPSTCLSKARYRVKWTRTDGTTVSRRYAVAGGAQSALAKALKDLHAPCLACAKIEVWESDPRLSHLGLDTDESLPLIRLEFPVYSAALEAVA